MPPFTVTHIEDDETLDGYYIEWYDPANLDGLPLTGYFHLTVEMVAELVLHHRTPNKAPDDKLQAVSQLVASNKQSVTPPGVLNLIADAWADAYNEIVQDRIDRHNFGMKAITRDGDADLEAVRSGAEVRPWNRDERSPADQGIKGFIQRRST